MLSIADKLSQLEYRALSSEEDPTEDCQIKIKKLLMRIDYSLPDDYLNFLSANPRTGMLMAACTRCDQEEEDDGYYPISLLFSFSARPEMDLLGLRGMRKDVPACFLIIGENSYGDLFCMDLRFELSGQVYYVEHGHFVSEESRFQLLARSFTSFIAALEHL